MDEEHMKEKLVFLIEMRNNYEEAIKELIQEYKGTKDDSIQYKHIIRTEFGLTV